MCPVFFNCCRCQGAPASRLIREAVKGQDGQVEIGQLLGQMRAQAKHANA